ncbi:N4-gp56 family major capsid protein [Flavobacterium sp.]|jgi:N4-gp56 family major capsid protein|uniref:N4-gp56 family major capsid protein n=1 Tax=Flavobacterium sp. TaxID=239 RepID=UPI0037C03A0A
MPIHNYNTRLPRTNTYAAKEMLTRVTRMEVSGKFAKNGNLPENMTDNITFRRLRPFNNFSGVELPNITNAMLTTPGGANLLLAEGTTPTTYNVDYVDVTMTLQNFGVLFEFSSKTQLLHEEDVPSDMVELAGDTMGEALELVRIGALVAASANVRLASNVANVNLVVRRLLAGDLRSAARTLANRRAKKITEILAPSVNVKTEPVEAAYIAMINTDAIPDVRDLTGFVHVSEYGQRKTISEYEVGSWEEFRFIAVPIMPVTVAAGGANSGSQTPPLLPGTSAAVDIYDTVILAQEAFGHVALRGRTAIKPTLLPATSMNHGNPMGLRGFVGVNTWYAARALNEAWMVRIRHGVSVQ